MTQKKYHSTNTGRETENKRLIKQTRRKRGGGEETGGRRGRKSTSNHKFNLVSILMSTELKCQQKCSQT